MIALGYAYQIALMLWALVGHRVPFTLRGWQAIIVGFFVIGLPCFLMASYGFSCSTGIVRWFWFIVGFYILLSYLILLPAVVLAIRMQSRDIDIQEPSPKPAIQSRKMQLLGMLLPIVTIVGWYLTFGFTRG